MKLLRADLSQEELKGLERRFAVPPVNAGGTAGRGRAGVEEGIRYVELLHWGAPNRRMREGDEEVSPPAVHVGVFSSRYYLYLIVQVTSIRSSASAQNNMFPASHAIEGQVVPCDFRPWGYVLRPSRFPPTTLCRMWLTCSINSFPAALMYMYVLYKTKNS